MAEQMAMTQKILLAMTLLLACMATGSSQKVGGGNVILTGYRMLAGTSLKSADYTFSMQTDCNLVLYGPAGAIWNSQTAGQGTACFVTLQADGNLVVYDAAQRAKWASGKYADPKKGPVYLILRPTGTVQILYATEAPQEVLWAIP